LNFPTSGVKRFRFFYILLQSCRCCGVLGFSGLGSKGETSNIVGEQESNRSRDQGRDYQAE